MIVTRHIKNTEGDITTMRDKWGVCFGGYTVQGNLGAMRVGVSLLEQPSIDYITLAIIPR